MKLFKRGLKEQECLIGILLFSFLVFSPVINFEFLKYDDVVHVTGNSLVKSLSMDNIAQIFRQSINRIYIPLTTLSFAFEYGLFKYNPAVFHLDNLILHLIVTTLVFYLLRRLGLSLAATSMATLLFTIHPMRVESIAWVSERKDVLYAAFYLAAMHAYLSFIDQKKKRYFLYSYLFGILSMLAKPMALSLPFILLIVHWYKDGKFHVRMLFDKLTYFLYIVPIVFLTWVKIKQTFPIDPASTILLKIWTYMFHIGKFIFPVDLLPVYSTPDPVTLANSEILLTTVVFVLYLIVIVRCFRIRLFIFANLFYIASVFFLLRNDYDVGWHMHIVSDRFMYLPSLGFCMLLGYFIEKLYLRFRQSMGRSLIVISVIAGIFFLTFVTSTQIFIWQNDHVLWGYAQKKNPTNHFVMHNNGVLYFEESRYERAAEYFTKSIELNPRWIRSYYYRGLTYERLGLVKQAANDFTHAIENNKIAPSQFQFKVSDNYLHRGVLLFDLSEWQRALDDFTQAIKHDPYNAKAYNNRGLVYDHLSNDQAALNDFNRSIELDPSEASTYVNRDQVTKN